MPESRTVVSQSIEDAFQYYLAHQDEFVVKYDGKVVAIKDERVLGIYDDYGAALTATAQDHEVGTFLLQRVSEGEGDYTVYVRSRAAAPSR